MRQDGRFSFLHKPVHIHKTSEFAFSRAMSIPYARRKSKQRKEDKFRSATLLVYKKVTQVDNDGFTNEFALGEDYF